MVGLWLRFSGLEVRVQHIYIYLRFAFRAEIYLLGLLAVLCFGGLVRLWGCQLRLRNVE